MTSACALPAAWVKPSPSNWPSGGAPIVSPDGVVESGNGRTIALRRSAQTGTEAWGRYQAELARQGIDTSGFDRPVLVRMRSEPMAGADRA